MICTEFEKSFTCKLSYGIKMCFPVELCKDFGMCIKEVLMFLTLNF